MRFLPGPTARLVIITLLLIGAIAPGGLAQTERPAAPEPTTSDSLTVSGNLVDGKGNPLVNAYVCLVDEADSSIIARELTDFDGNYSMKAASPKSGHTVSLKFSYLGKELVYSKISQLNGLLTLNGSLATRQYSTSYRRSACSFRPYINPEAPGGIKRMTADMLPSGW